MARAAPPEVTGAWSSSVFATSATLGAEINPGGLATGYHLSYITESGYQANLAGGADGFEGAHRIPAFGTSPVGSGTEPVKVERSIAGLSPATAYRYRFVASNAEGTDESPALSFTTFAMPSGAADPCPNALAREQTGAHAAGLADCRAFEMVSPVEKNGGQVDRPGTLSGGGVLQAASQGGRVTWGSAASFGTDAQGAPGASQYVSRRTGSGWQSENVTVPIFSGSFWGLDQGVAYRNFSGDLARGLLLSGRHCRSTEEDGCPVANPPLEGTEAPPGYQNYYVRDTSSRSFSAVLTHADIAGLGLDPAEFSLSAAGATPDLRHIALSTCAALTEDATEVPGSGDACDPDYPNLYLWSQNVAGLRVINVGPVSIQSIPGAQLAAQSGAISTDGNRVYWVGSDDGLYLREGSETKVVSPGAGDPDFQIASADGSVAYFLSQGHLHRYRADLNSSEDLTPQGGVEGVLGASHSGDRIYFLDAEGLKLWRNGQIVTVAPGPEAADPSTYPPQTGAARVSANGRVLVFLSRQSLTGYDNIGLTSDEPESQVFRFEDTGAGELACISCNPSGARPKGPSTIPGSYPNGTGPHATDAYKPRVMTSDGKRIFFDSGDSISLTDTNNAPDAYQWRAEGTGGCVRQGGCLSLVSSGRASGGAQLIDVSAGGTDVFFLTSRSLVSHDPGGLDLYVARAGGGFTRASAPIPCVGDACQDLPPEPPDPAITTLVPGRGNPAVHFRSAVRNCAPIARRAVSLRRTAIRTTRRARRATHPRQTARLTRRARTLNRQAQRAIRVARRCRQASPEGRG